jgi:hypothetical protein
MEVLLKRHERVADLLALDLTERKLHAVMRLCETKPRVRSSWLRGVPLHSPSWQARHPEYKYRASDALRLVLPKIISPELAIELSKITRVRAYDILHAHACDRLKELGVKF